MDQNPRELEVPVLGPVQAEDKLLLQAVIKMTLPRLVLELGCLKGDSTKAILDALPVDSYLVAIDQQKTHEIAELEFRDLRLVFFEGDQTRPLLKLPFDLVFFDASHELTKNVKTFEWLEPLLTKEAILAVHDTGYWPYNPFESFTHGKEVEGKGYAHRPEEIMFVEYLKSEGWNRINFGTTRVFRHGMTLLQR